MIYFDNAATTKIDEKVRDIMFNSYDNIWANPSSLHSKGFEAEKSIRKAREKISKHLGVNSKNIFFTPSGTISNNAVLKNFEQKDKNIVISSIEHSSIYNASLNLDCEFRYAKVDKYGFVDEENLISLIDENTVLVSIIHINNELGTINDINKLSSLVKEKNKNIKFHSDGVQAFNKISINLSNIDFYTISSHKINGPKGISGLYIKNPENFKSFYYGGGQELNIFSGTENIQAILGFAEASDLDNNYLEISNINKYLRKELSKIKDCIIISPEENCSPYILSTCFKGIGSEIMLHYLEMDDIYISTGSACNKNEKSKVIESINIEKEYKNGCLRISFDRNSTIDEARVFIEKLKEKLDIIRNIIKK